MSTFPFQTTRDLYAIVLRNDLPSPLAPESDEEKPQSEKKEGAAPGQPAGENNADKAKGALKDAAGKVMNDKKLQAEGNMDKAKGEAHQALGDAKDAVKHANDD